MSNHRVIDIPELGDAALPLEIWLQHVQGLISLHGKDAVMSVDAGFNNVVFTISVPVPSTFRRLSRSQRILLEKAEYKVMHKMPMSAAEAEVLVDVYASDLRDKLAAQRGKEHPDAKRDRLELEQINDNRRKDLQARRVGELTKKIRLGVAISPADTQFLESHYEEKIKALTNEIHRLTYRDDMGR